jgi:hypothetical protein
MMPYAAAVALPFSRGERHEAVLMLPFDDHVQTQVWAAFLEGAPTFSPVSGAD